MQHCVACKDQLTSTEEVCGILFGMLICNDCLIIMAHGAARTPEQHQQVEELVATLAESKWGTG